MRKNGSMYSKLTSIESILKLCIANKAALFLIYLPCNSQAVCGIVTLLVSCTRINYNCDFALQRTPFVINRYWDVNLK